MNTKENSRRKSAGVGLTVTNIFRCNSSSDRSVDSILEKNSTLSKNLLEETYESSETNRLLVCVSLPIGLTSLELKSSFLMA